MRDRAWEGLHQALDRSGRWRDYPRDEPLPVVKGTVIQVTVERLPDGRKPLKDLWLWHCGPAEADVDLLRKAYLRRFDQEHFHRFCKVYLGLGVARLASAEATGRWAALVMATHTQLRLASVLVDDLRRPWHKRPEPGQVLSPYRVRLGFRRLRTQLGTPRWDGERYPARPPGRPRGSKNRPKTRPGGDLVRQAAEVEATPAQLGHELLFGVARCHSHVSDHFADPPALTQRRGVPLCVGGRVEQVSQGHELGGHGRLQVGVTGRQLL